MRRVQLCAECLRPIPCVCARDMGWIVKPRKRWRSKKFLEFVRSMSCSVPDCRSRSQIEAAHFGPRGYGTKVHDCLAIPLCRDHHVEAHRYGKGWEHYESVEYWQIQTMAAAIVSGLKY